MLGIATLTPAYGSRRWVMGLLATVMVSLAGCIAGGPTLEGIVEFYYKSLAAHEFDWAAGQISENSPVYATLKELRGSNKEKLKLVLQDRYESIQRRGGIDSMKSKEVRASCGTAGTAQVDLTLKFKNGDTHVERFDLVKESGVWKISLK